MLLKLTWIAAALLCSARAPAEMQLASTDLAPGKSMANAQLFNQFGCNGGNRSPDLAWSGAPDGTRSYAILAFDPDAPTGSGWWHWVVFNIPKSVTHVSTGASQGGMPEGAIQGRSDFGISAYGGACPPPGGGMHRYQFTVYALSDADLTKSDFPVDANAPAAMVSFLVHSSALAHATIEVHYRR